MFYCYKMGSALDLEWERITDWPYSFGSRISHLGEEIKTIPPWPKCKLYQSPLLPKEFFSDLRFPPGKENQWLPDIIGQPIQIISDKVLKIIQRVDDFPHQVEEINFVDSENRKIERERYWYFNIRRRLYVQSIGAKPNIDFYGRELLGTIQSIPELREKVEQLPIWQDQHGPEFYFNEELMSHLKKENLRHFKEYQSFGGREDESIGHVW